MTNTESRPCLWISHMNDLRNKAAERGGDEARRTKKTGYPHGKLSSIVKGIARSPGSLKTSKNIFIQVLQTGCGRKDTMISHIKPRFPTKTQT